MMYKKNRADVFAVLVWESFWFSSEDYKIDLAKLLKYLSKEQNYNKMKRFTLLIEDVASKKVYDLLPKKCRK